ncbi:MAG TPA: DUF748 domain-containing protein [Burkholderiaceae bacterium]|nr:DUF748 domain-containing protein [Burkholderiaceae bacterium]
MSFQLNVIKKNKWIRRAAWVVGGVAAVWAASWLLVPPLLKSQGEKMAGEALGRKVGIGSVDFKPWTLELTLNDLTVAKADGAAPQLRVKRLYFDGELQSLLRFAPVVDAVQVDDPQLQLAHLGDGRYDVDDVLERLRRPSDKPPAEPTRFALYNLALRGGAADFSDQPQGKTHTLRDLQLSVPFLSNLPADREVKVEPRLAFLLNSSRFDSAATGTPFAQTGKADASVRIAGLDLAPYLRYIPASVPVKLKAAVLHADLQVAFEQAPKMSLKVSGTVEARDTRLADAQALDLLAFDALKVTLADVRPLEQAAKLSALELSAPRLAIRRDKGGRLNLEFAVDSEKESAGSPSQPKPHAWKIQLDKLALRDGQVAWTDETTGSPAQMELRELVVEVSSVAFPFSQPLQFGGSAVLAGAAPPGKKGASLPKAATLRFSGNGTDLAARLDASLAGLPLDLAAPYLAQAIKPTLSGSLDAELNLDWNAPAEPGKEAQLLLRAPRLRLSKLALRDAGSVLASMAQLQLNDAQADLVRQTIVIGKLALTQPQARLERDQDRHWMFESWLLGGEGVSSSPAPKWAVVINELLLDGGALSYRDQATAKPVAFELSALKLEMKNVAPDSAKPSPLTASARVASGQTEPGSLALRGSLSLATLAAQGDVEALRIPAHAFEPYFGEALNMEILRADASFKGRVSYAGSPAGPLLKIAGDSAIEEFRANSVPVRSSGLEAGEQVLSWKALSLRGLSIVLAPGTAPAAEVQETALSDFFARLVIHESGRINLQDLLKPPANATIAPAADTVGALDPIIRFGPISLLNGKVFFSDRFVKPNYSADLSELNGKLSAFSSTPAQGTPQLADLELRGRAEGTASLEILGKLNPLAKPLALDIKGKVRDLELPPLSPYAVKYAGHGIERGKLSLDLAYQVLPDGQLTASNRLVLNQLSFGDKVEGAPSSLPVKLAVALLADRNGVIDLDLPISGSLNDPQFSLGPVIFKLIVNLVVKAITSPFSLLAGAIGGGGDELSTVGFAPGSALLAPQAREGLEKVAKALGDRPALKMTVVGTASLEIEREAYRRERLNALVLAEKRRAAVLAGAAPTTAASQAASAAVSGGDAQYPALLKQVYKRADIPKPRNVLGMAKDLPVAEMEALLLAQIPVNEDLMRELALQRGVAVRDYLASRQLSPERLFLGAAKAVAPDAKWSPRAELSLATP